MGGIVGSVADVFGVGPASEQKKASQSASKASEAAAKYASDIQKQMFDKQLELQAPFRESGLAAQNRLNALLGLGPRYDQSFNNFNAGAYLNANPDAKAWVASKSGQPSGSFTMPTGFKDIAGAAFGMSNRIGGGASPNKSAEQLAYEHFVADGSRRTGDFFRNQAPAADYGKYARDFSMQDFTTDPGYAFRMSEGMKALDRQAAARGGLISGGALKAAQRYGQDLGSQEYTNAFNRYQVNRANQLSPLQGLIGAGQSSANTLGGAAQSYGQNVGGIALGNAENQANQLVARGDIRAGQYGAIGKGIGQMFGSF